MCMNFSPIDDLIEVDIDGYMEAGIDPSCELEVFDLDGKEETRDGRNDKAP